MIQHFDGNVLTQIKDEMKLNLKSLEEKYGITFAIDRIRFTDKTFNMRIESAINTEGMDSEKLFFINKCKKFALSSTDYGRTFDHGGDIFTVCGINTKSRKYNLLARNSRGEIFGFRASILCTKEKV